ncbi:diguanylate cyclase [Marinomonas sp. 5E14-1]|uniref:diguanylate cyclase domain-containing protein n=1 Tax=Marinomonas sp. 5E14-1 TaxID=3153922 RepID=UPI003267BB48
MATDTSNSSLKEQQILQSRLANVEKERDFIKKLYGDVPKILEVISKGAPLNALLNRFKSKLQALLSNTYCLFLVSDKDCLQWRLQFTDSINADLPSSNGLLSVIPQDLLSFAATSSRPKQHDVNIQQALGWKKWQPFLSKHAFTSVSMVSVSDGQGSIYLMLSFQEDNPSVANNLMELALDSYASWLNAAFERAKADFLLLENNHRDPNTSLLRRYSFDDSFGMVLKDSRRHFQRAALLSLHLLQDIKIDMSELKELADVMSDSVRDNDLIAHYDEREFVMGIRIQHLEDAEVVAQKVLDSLKKAECSSNRLMRAGLAIGIAFYPEHSTLELLHKAASSAAYSLGNTSGYRLEFHDAFYKSSSECYSL